MTRVFAFLVVCAVVVPASAVQIVNYSWEDGAGTILGSYGNLVDDLNITGPQTGSSGNGGTYTCPGARTGDRYLHVAEDPHDGTPQAYVAFITGLTDGDVVSGSFFGYDESPGLSPSLRIWGHYALSTDITAYKGSASGNSDYTAGTGWDEVSHSWTFDSDGGTRDALVIEARLYSYPSTADDHTDFWIDDLTVVAPDGASVLVAPEPTTLGLLLLGGVATALRRRGR